MKHEYVRYYGVVLTKRGTFTHFIQRDPNTVPKNAIVVVKTFNLSSNSESFLFFKEYVRQYTDHYSDRLNPEEIEKQKQQEIITNAKVKAEQDAVLLAREEARAEANRKYLEAIERANTIAAGTMVVCADSEGHHNAIVLDGSKEELWLLFCTSSRHWNPMARKLTTDELSLLGFPKKSKSSTYFAPVYRPRSIVSVTDVVFPAYRVDELRREFDSEKSKMY